MGLLEGKVAVVTGAGHGIGRSEALELAQHGARVVINDLGSSVTGVGSSRRAADVVAALVRERGGTAIANYDDVSDWEGAENILQQALAAYGTIDVLVNNAGIWRVGELVDLAEDDWDSMIRVHLKGTMAMMRHCGRYWKQSAQTGQPPSGAVINTTSLAGMPGHSRGQAAYAAAKAAIAALSVIASYEFADFGIRVNAISPSGSTRMRTFVREGRVVDSEDQDELLDGETPATNGPLVAWLASDLALHVTGQVFAVRGGTVGHFASWSETASVTKEGRWSPAELGDAINEVIFKSKARYGRWQMYGQSEATH